MLRQWPLAKFHSNIVLPDKAAFDPAVDAHGNLLNVTASRSAGSLFFSEYDASAHVIRMTGTITGPPPYLVAIIHLAN